jgi:NAD+ diphosphatase
MDTYNEQKYRPDFHSSNSMKDNDWCLIMIEKKIVMKKDGSNFFIPEIKELEGILKDDEALEYIGKYEEHDCYCTTLKEITVMPGHLYMVDLREITKYSGDPGLFLLAGNANHIQHWKHVNRFCGCCGHETSDKTGERAKICTNCGNIVYPRISPAIITAIFREDEILLAHNRNFKNDLHSLIAGFVEPGETLEQCVAREIYEEVGIKVKNIRYFCSQPWPFPDSLMLAFTAEYESGEITVDKQEITHADWYKADNLPEIPSTDSVAGKMIRWYRDKGYDSSN